MRSTLPKCYYYFIPILGHMSRCSDEIAFLWYFEINSPIDYVIRVINYIYLLWETGAECDRHVTPMMQADDNVDVGE